MNPDEILLKKKPAESKLPPFDPSNVLTKKKPLKEIWDWARNMNPQPYVRFRDLNQGEGSSKPAVEVGIKISF